MTPGAPFGHGDGVQFYGTNVTYHCGCMDLLSEVQTRVKPKIHVFGTCDKGKHIENMLPHDITSHHMTSHDIT